MGYMKTNLIQLNIVDFLEKTEITQNKFRQLWSDCEWENIINIKQKGISKVDFLENLKK